MGTYDLQSTQAKLDRAQQHLSEFKAQLKIDGEKQLYGITVYDDFKTHETVMKVLKPHAVFVGYSVTVGEIVHQMRSALEHLIWQMVPKPEEGVTGFPVFDFENPNPANPDKWCYESKRRRRMIQGINSTAATIIRGLQPFATGSDQRLHLLNEMWKRDKHRLLNLTSVVTRAVSPIYIYPDDHAVSYPTIAVPDLDDGAEFCRIPHPPNYVPSEVKMIAEVDVAIRFIDGPAIGQSPEELLDSLLRLTRDIVHRLAQTPP